jgi:L-asparaginase type II
VVLVGAMRPSTAISADGPANLFNAVVVAANPDSHGRGVMVALNDQIHSARGVSKTNTSTPDAFKTTELGMLGYVQAGKPYFYNASTRKHTVESEFDIANLTALPQVDIVYGYANVGPVALDALVNAGAKGIIHAGVGNGSVSSKVLPSLKAARAKGVVVVRSSRVGQGILARNGEANDDELDFVAADTLSPQKARILLMLALTRTSNTKDIQRMFWAY